MQQLLAQRDPAPMKAGGSTKETSPEGVTMFFVVLVPQAPLLSTLNLLRILFRPKTKVPAHITTAGPFEERTPPGDARCLIDGASLTIRGVGTFFKDGERQQNTVFLGIEAPSLRMIWHKPDYPEFSPHLTMYDGDSREEAERIRELLEIRQFQLIDYRITRTDLQVLEVQKGMDSLLYPQCAEQLRALGIKSLEELARMSFGDRFDLAVDVTKSSHLVSQ